MYYEIKYTTDEVPDELPMGATVTEVSLLPLEMATSLSCVIEVEADMDGDTYLTIREIEYGAGHNDVCALLNNHEARRVAHALLEAIGEKID